MPRKRASGQLSLFTPGFGRRPNIVAGRSDVIEAITENVLLTPDHSDGSNLIFGQRGFGKTVLLNEIEDQVSAEGWVVLKIDAVSSDASSIEQRIASEAAKHPFAQEMLEKEQTPNMVATTRARGHGIRMWWASFSENTSESLRGPSARDTLEALGSAAAEHGTGVLLTVDELHAGKHDELVRLAADLQLVAPRGGLPVAFVGAALPEVLYSTLKDPRLSFFRRCEQFEIGALSDEDIRSFFARGVRDGGGTIGDEAREAMVQRSGGYPYKMQLLGDRAWKHAHAPNRAIEIEDVTFADLEASEIVRKRVHEPVWLNLNQEERAVVQAVAAHKATATRGEVPLGDVSDALPRSPDSITDMLDRLDAVGVITYNHDTFLRLGPLIDQEFVSRATAALRQLGKLGSAACSDADEIGKSSRSSPK